MKPVDEFHRLESHLHGSVLYRRVEAVAAIALSAFAYAHFTRRIRDGRDRFAAHSTADRVRAVAVFVASAALGHLLLLRFVPAHIAPATPNALWILIAAAALFAAVFAGGLAAGWPSSRLATILFRAARRQARRQEP